MSEIRSAVRLPSGRIGRQLLELGLIDEIDLHIAPIVLGEGCTGAVMSARGRRRRLPLAPYRPARARRGRPGRRVGESARPWPSK
jgi:hypothetical protein